MSTVPLFGWRTATGRQLGISPGDLVGSAPGKGVAPEAVISVNTEWLFEFIRTHFAFKLVQFCTGPHPLVAFR